MKKMMMVAAFALCAAAPVRAQGAGTNQWAVGISVTQTAVAVRINNISVTTLPDGKVAVAVSWAWLDAQGKTVRSGVTRYAQAEIDAKLQAKGLSIEALRALFLAIAREEAVAP